MDKKVILCAGGDLRQSYMCDELCEYGKVYALGIDGTEHAVKINSLDELPCMADILVLPIMGGGTDLDIGSIRYELKYIAGHVKHGGLVVGGKLSAVHKRIFADMRLDAEDYFQRETLAVKNALLTAEGTLAAVLSMTAKTVYESRVLIIGYGRCGKACARLFKAVGAECAVSARKDTALAQAWADGINSFALCELKEKIGGFDVIINTVPAMVLDSEVLSAVRPGGSIIDISSEPGGVDFGVAKTLGINAVHALGLPAKTAPESAGKLIAQTIVDIMKERGHGEC